MNEKLPPIYFFIPQDKIPSEGLPPSPDDYWQWQCKYITPRTGAPYFWILQTYLYLKANGFPCEFAGTIPDEGIILSHRWFLDDSLRPNPKQLFVCIRADVHKQHPYAQLHVVQNLKQLTPKILTIWESYYMPHWPQPDIIARNLNREDKFENVAFYGNEENLASVFKTQAWQEQLNDIGLQFQTKMTYKEWNDYSNIDVVLAVRGLGRKNDFSGKPASKLYNAWHAGVPAILNYESAYRAERKSQLDYLEITSIEEIVSALKRLKDDKELRQAMVENGRIRAQETKPDKIIARWTSFLCDRAVPAYHQWRSRSRWQQQALFTKRDSYIALRNLKYKFT